MEGKGQEEKSIDIDGLSRKARGYCKYVKQSVKNGNRFLWRYVLPSPTAAVSSDCAAQAESPP